MDLFQALKFTHRELCEIGAKWLQKSCRIKCPVVFTELVSVTDERPDVIGFNSRFSVLLEIKNSRSDFLADKKKFFREFPEKGMGDFRLYVCPKGLIKAHEIPEKWGLVYVDFNGKCRTEKQIFTGNYDQTNRFREKNERGERLIMYSALRRVTNWDEVILTSKSSD